jgi:multiple sugar transport system permease protein
MTTTRAGRTAGVSGWSGRALVTAVVTIFVLFFLVPMAWLLLATTKSARDLTVGHPFAPGTLGDLATNAEQLFAFQDGAVTMWVGNSAGYAVGALLITIIASIPAGYAMALTEFRFRRLLLVLTLIVMLIPNTALVLPIFRELKSVGLIGSPLPRDLLAAARIDGCTEIQVFTRVALPLAAPIVALVAFFSFVQSWNNFFLPFVMLPSSDGYPIQVGLTSLLASTPAFNPSSAGSESVQLPTLALATVVSVLPVLIVFLFSQRFLVAGMTAGGTKE